MAARSLTLLLALLCPVLVPAQEGRPNVIVIMTDDQGWGDFGFHGNPVIRTPNLDRLAAGSARMTQFYVCPVCTPTRSALMTGRWSQRTRAFDTWIGRAMMEPDEVTVAELLREAGYATGVFGKWHLGDCWPMRAIDQGFDEALVHRGGGIGQPADPFGAEGRYTDPVLFHNGEREACKGYCTDIYFDSAIAWMKRQRAAEKPFFVYLPTNAPHSPLHDVPTELYEEYRKVDHSPSRYPQERGHELPEKHDADRHARIFSMITNIDDNVGKLVSSLREMGELENTLIIYLNDNGPNTRRYVGGFKGKKGSVYEGGVRSPLWMHWPGKLEPRDASNRISAHVDVTPTILEACGVAPSRRPDFDGRSLWGTLKRGDEMPDDRAIVIQAHRGNAPVRYHHCLVRTQRWKLVNHSGFGPEFESVTPQWELYDMVADPYEERDVAAENPDVVRLLAWRYDRWFDDVAATRDDPFTPPRIGLGGAQQRVVLTRQDWRREKKNSSWGGPSNGHWFVDVVAAGRYRVTLRSLKNRKAGSATVEVGSLKREILFETEQRIVQFECDLEVGTGRVRAELKDSEGLHGPYQVVVERIG